MNRKIAILVVSMLLLWAVACKKKEEETTSAAAPAPTVVEEPEQVVEEPKPVIEVEEPTETGAFDPSRYNLLDVYFDFDRSDLRGDTREALNRYAEVLKANPDINVLIEGHCDERGTEEYNLGLGERRATRVRDYLVTLGVNGSRLKTISYGELRPKAMGSSEEAWAQNRRAHFQLSK